VEYIHSLMLTNTFRKVFPLVVMPGISLFSSSENFPERGFQSGVAMGTIAVLFDRVFHEKTFTDWI